MIKDAVRQLFEEQIKNWETARNNYNALIRIKTRTLQVDGHSFQVQFNPARMISSSARPSARPVRQQDCFLCPENRPPEQKGLLFKERYWILVNPYPVFPRHLTISSVEHTPQRIESRLGDMLDLAQQLDDYVFFYNGPECGASVPGHFHFQAGNKGIIPIEKDRNFRHAIRMEADSRQEIITRFQDFYRSPKKRPGDGEPPVNLLAWHEEGKWTLYLFPRKKHRPSCYFAEGEKNILISPASVEMGGLFITPLEKDFLKITSGDIALILDEVCD
jgi:hypothetical protein